MKIKYKLYTINPLLRIETTLKEYRMALLPSYETSVLIECIDIPVRVIIYCHYTHLEELPWQYWTSSVPPEVEGTETWINNLDLVKDTLSHRELDLGVLIP